MVRQTQPVAKFFGLPCDTVDVGWNVDFIDLDAKAPQQRHAADRGMAAGQDQIRLLCQDFVGAATIDREGCGTGGHI